jgi:hypothetical protein
VSFAVTVEKSNLPLAERANEDFGAGFAEGGIYAVCPGIIDVFSQCVAQAGAADNTD